MISTDSKYGAAMPAKAIISTAPMLKFGAINTREFARWLAHSDRVSILSGVKPDVPTTASIPCLIQKARVSITTCGFVKSTTTSQRALVSSSSESSTSIAATNSHSGSACTAATVLAPIFPFAPITPTRIILPIIDLSMCADSKVVSQSPCEPATFCKDQ